VEKLEELAGLLTGPKAWPAVAALDRAFPEDLWRRWELRRRDAGSDVGELRS